MDKETSRERIKQFRQWACTHEHNMQISAPRSGRNWMRHIISTILDKPNGLPVEIEPGTYDDYDYFDDHWPPGGPQPETARYIVLVRDPRDAFLSHAYYRIRADKEGDNLELVAGYLHNDDWRQKEVSLWRHVLSLLMYPRSILIQYERLCLYPEETVGRVLRFIGLESWPSVADVVATLDRLGDGHFGLRNAPFRKMTYRDGRARYDDHCLRWQSDSIFTKAEEEWVWSELGDVMIHFGYTEHGHSDQLLLQ